jgi:ABC-type molybdate transport system permease subunit
MTDIENRALVLKLSLNLDVSASNTVLLIRWGLFFNVIFNRKYFFIPPSYVKPIALVLLLFPVIGYFFFVLMDDHVCNFRMLMPVQKG